MAPSPESGPLTFDRLRNLWPGVVGGFGGMDGALLRPTNPVALQAGRLVVDCSDIFRRDRLVERSAPGRIAEELGKLTGERIRVEFVVQDKDDVSLPPPGPADQVRPTPADPPPAAPEPGPAPAGPARDQEEDPFPGEDSADSAQPSDPVLAGAAQEGPDRDPEAFFEEAEISVTELKSRSGSSLF